jgi:predicted aspartyl protease
MARIRGSLDSTYCPVIPIAVSASSGPSTFVDAVIDTGFTGFVQLPARAARELSLTPRATSETRYADGRVDAIPLAWGRVTLGSAIQEGFLHIQRGSDEAIVGVEFLRLFRKTLVVSIADEIVLLVDSLADLSAQ